MGRSKGDQQVMSALASKVAGIVSGTDQPTARASRPRKQSTPAVAYMRCSGIGQVDGDTWDRQEASVRKYAAANGLAVADLDWFRDEGVSGTKDMGDRPGLAALLDRVESNGVRVVLKLRAARERIRRRAGRCEGRKPYGSRPGEAAVIARIRELHRKPHGGQRRSLQEIADVLNAETVTTRTGKPWSKGTLHQIIARGLKAPDGQE